MDKFMEIWSWFAYISIYDNKFPSSSVHEMPALLFSEI